VKAAKSHHKILGSLLRRSSTKSRKFNAFVRWCCEGKTARIWIDENRLEKRGSGIRTYLRSLYSFSAKLVVVPLLALGPRRDRFWLIHRPTNASPPPASEIGSRLGLVEVCGRIADADSASENPVVLQPPHSRRKYLS
jgi:hypothetical protein